ncbi:hypothetical protein A2801_00535 [Candidatus Woesebacteria bacterium RIFCSPHIGHO2_01_FULL_41_10]|uniref:ZIP zinc transporter n=1 Tax=Candidatus Woesebacteria bacterium RIFCSPHIGHO2_01_FULL_41_10 TaxID=1802500 RepID=A0A1F7YRM8_9BACT|nr:MAG: hypothetical protein A2801_00535 [Candidatus Woesebacteria bacterium RIFCSPHIGHO2_01_FULL_41_10]
MGNLLQLFLLALLGSVIALIGGVVFLFNKKLSSVLQTHSIPFAAGVLITVSLVGLIPEAIDQMGENALIVVLIAFFLAYLFEYFIVDIHHHAEDHHHHSKVSVPLVVVGDTIHNFIDGVAIAASFFVSPGLGLITSLSTFLHEVPHEIGDFGILLKAGYGRKKVLLINLVSASATLVGAFVTVFIPEDSSFTGIMLAISAGIFLYLGAIDFLPHISDGHSSKLKSVVPLGLGIIIMVATLMLVPHSHEDESRESQLPTESTFQRDY